MDELVVNVGGGVNAPPPPNLYIPSGYDSLIVGGWAAITAYMATLGLLPATDQKAFVAPPLPEVLKPVEVPLPEVIVTAPSAVIGATTTAILGGTVLLFAPSPIGPDLDPFTTPMWTPPPEEPLPELVVTAPPYKPPTPAPPSLDPIMPPNWNDLAQPGDQWFSPPTPFVPVPFPFVPVPVPEFQPNDPNPELQPYYRPNSVPDGSPGVADPLPFADPYAPTRRTTDPSPTGSPTPVVGPAPIGDPYFQPVGDPGNKPAPFAPPAARPRIPDPTFNPGNPWLNPFLSPGSPFADPNTDTSPNFAAPPNNADRCNCSKTNDKKKKNKKKKKTSRDKCVEYRNRQYADGTVRIETIDVPCIPKKGRPRKQRSDKGKKRGGQKYGKPGQFPSTTTLGVF